MEWKQLTEEAKRVEEELSEAKEERDSAKKVCCGGGARWEMFCGWGRFGGILWAGHSGSYSVGGARWEVSCIDLCTMHASGPQCTEEEVYQGEEAEGGGVGGT